MPSKISSDAFENLAIKSLIYKEGMKASGGNRHGRGFAFLGRESDAGKLRAR